MPCGARSVRCTSPKNWRNATPRRFAPPNGSSGGWPNAITAAPQWTTCSSAPGWHRPPRSLASYALAWEPHTLTDPDVPELFRRLRAAGVKIGVLSNTMWPRSMHEQVFIRDGVLELIDGAVYSSEIEWTKPHPEAFRAAMAAVGVTDPAACVFVGDRPYDDVFGAKRAGMRAVLVPNSDVPTWPEAEPDAVIGRLADLAPLIDAWQRG